MNRREALKKTAAITGVAISSSVALSILNGCKPSGKIDWQPKFLTEEEVKTVSAISETILPKTNTPGAIDLHVPEFIDIMLNDTVPLGKQKSFRDELSTFNNWVNKEYEKPFEECNIEEQNKILETEEIKSDDRSIGQKISIYNILKEFTLLGYFTSEYVMTNVLNYNPVPGRFNGCIPLLENDKIYVDNNLLIYD